MPGCVMQQERRNGGQDRILTNRLVTIVSGRRGEVVTADTVNLGPGGMFVATEAPLGVGDRFICRIDLGEPYKPVLSGGEVRWVSSDDGPRGMGVQFLDIGEAAESLSGELVPPGMESVRVRMQTLGSALQAKVVRKADQALTIDVELPFLQLGSPVDVGPDIAARRGTIEAVEWRTGTDGLPRVRLSLTLEPTAVSLATQRVTGNSPEPPAEVEPRDQTGEARSVASTDTIRAGWQGHAKAPTVRQEKTVTRKAPLEIAPESPAPADCHEEDALSPEEQALLQRPSFPGEPFIRALGGKVGSLMILCWSRLVGWARKQDAHPRWAPLRARMTRLGLTTRRGAGTVLQRGSQLRAHLSRWAQRLWQSVRRSRLLRRPRRQSRGESSRLVHRLTERARQAAASHARTLVVVLLLGLGAAGLLAVGYGLLGSGQVTESQEEITTELSASGGLSPAWQDPQPALPAPSEG